MGTKEQESEGAREREMRGQRTGERGNGEARKRENRGRDNEGTRGQGSGEGGIGQPSLENFNFNTGTRTEEGVKGITGE